MKTILILLSFFYLISCQSDEQSIEINYDKDQPQIQWAMAKLTDEIDRLDTNTSPIKINILTEKNGSESYSLESNKNEITLTGQSLNGTMYGILELTEQLRNSGTLADIASKKESARFPFRAIKVNLPWDSYRRSEALQLHMETMKDINYWRDFLDMMAENRFNVLTLWNLHPFNYMIRPTNFPEACGFSDEEMVKWQSFWTSLFKMAKDRGIETYMVNWNIFVSPEFAEHYKAAEYSKDGAFFTDGDTSDIVKKYTRECVTQVINEFPDLTGLGITLGEGMGAMTPRQREAWLLETIIQGARDADRKIKFIHRVPLSANTGSGGSTDQRVEAMTRETLDTLTCFEIPIWTELKFNWSHAYSSTTLVKVHGGPLTDTYWNPSPTNYKINWMMRNEDFFILRWGQSDFIRQHILENGHNYVGGYYVGSECYYPAVDYFTDRAEKPWKYAFERQWLFYKEWGRLLYNPNTPNDVFENEFVLKYGSSGKNLFEAYNLASKVPLEIASFWNGTWDFTLYSEGFLAQTENHGTNLISLSEMIDRTPLDPAYVSIKAYVDLTSNGKTVEAGKIDPLTLANRMEIDCIKAMKNVDQLPGNDDFAFQNEIADIKAWSNLGLYFAEKLRGGVEIARYETTKNRDNKKNALIHMEKAANYWKELVTITTPLYREVPLVHLNTQKDPYFHWSKYEDAVMREIDWVKAR